MQDILDKYMQKFAVLSKGSIKHHVISKGILFRQLNDLKEPFNETRRFFEKNFRLVLT
jgi:hypothetical protein